MNEPAGAAAKTPGVVTTAFIMSILGFVCGIPAVIGLILGIVGRPKAKAAGSGVGLATAAIVISAAWLAIGLIGTVAVMASGGNSSDTAASETASATEAPVASEAPAPSSAAAVATESAVAESSESPSPSPEAVASEVATPEATEAASPVVVFEDGDWIVGSDFPAGTYTLIDEPSFCYWGIYEAGTNQENIIANDNVTGGHPTVVLKEGQEFTSSDCGAWATDIPAALATEFGDGVWKVGRDLKPGTYTLIDEPSACYWGIYKSGSNSQKIIANDNVNGGHPTVVIKKGMDFASNDCGTWASSIPAALATEFGDGVWTVGRDIKPGKYRLTEAVIGNCYWGIYKSGSNGQNILSNDIVDSGRPFVTLKKATDFASSDCGSWAPM
ncbi:MAG: DUF4190 domain-containing protein [Actinobacteria bacterium]|nr:DUF4190 domain-containing protein [Actinomycetota bacterium]